jgi:hypothetical protein
VDDVLEAHETMDSRFVDSFYKMTKEEIKHRIENDPDYQEKRQSG